MRVLRRPQLMEKTGYSPAHIDRLEKAGVFPKRVQLGPKSIGWIESEVDDWIRQRIAERDQGAA